MSNSNGPTIDPRWTGGSAPYPRDAGLAELFERQVRARPEALAIDAGSERLTYAELDARASRMAHVLRDLGVDEETPVGVFMGPRVEQIVAQVAICKAGGSYVPLDPEYPRERLEFMIADAGVEVVLTDRRQPGPRPHCRVTLDVDDDRAVFERRPPSFPARPGGAERRTHILYTSGSTGKPKGIEIVARGVTRLVLGTNYVEIAASDRFAQIANFSFDAAIFEVWGPLLNGATIVPLSRRLILDPHEFRAALAGRGVTVMFLTTALFNFVAQVCPDAFQTLRYLLMGGEKHNPEASRAVLAAGPPQRLLHCYGPTESTTFTTTCVLDAGLVSGTSVPIGGPIANTQVFILDEAQRPVKVGEVGELYIGGDGLARGYLDRPELTAERFVTVAGLGEGGERRLYRTGDQGRWRPDGLIEFVGRTDFQVKIRGHRIELEEVEAAITASGLVTQAALTVQEAHGEKSLVGHVVPRDPVNFAVAMLQEHLLGKLPRYMVPARFVTLDALPLNANGKVDRKALAEGQGQSGVFSVNAMMAAAHDPVTAELGAIWAELLGVEVVLPDDDFFQLGGSSLLAARLVLRVRDVFKIRFPIYALYEAGTLRECAAVVRRARQGDAGGASGTTTPEPWRTDARLPGELGAEIDRGNGRAVAPEAWRTGTVFLTGVTGFLGAFMLHDLLTRTSARACCLVRARDAESGGMRLRQALAKYGLWRPGFAERVEVVAGDLRRPRFGLDRIAFAALAEAVDAVFHCAAHVNYVQPYAAHRATNVGGTIEVVRLAASRRMKPLHHVSSIAVFGPSGFLGGSPRVLEDTDLLEHLPYLPLDIGYSPSKWAAEMLVWEAARIGLPAAVYRPGFIMGDSQTGAGNADDFVGRIVRGTIQIGSYPDLPRQRKEFVPVDYVSRAILHIAGSADSLGRAYHLVPPDWRISTDSNDFFELIRGFGYPMIRRPYADWVERAIEDSRRRDNPLCPLLPMLLERVYHDERTRWELYENMPAYDVTNTLRALAGSEVRFHAMDAELLGRYLRYWIRAGLLPDVEVGAPQRVAAGM